MAPRKWLVDFEVISDAALSDKVTEGQIIFEGHPPGSYTAQVRNFKTSPGTLDPILSVQIILDGEGLESTREKATDHLLELLDCLTLTFNISFKRHKTKRLIDWTPGLVQRECFIFREFADPNTPYPILNEDYLKSVALFLHCDKDESLGLAMRWYRRALIADASEETFQYFWFALEILAERGKGNVLVPDRCPQCRTPLLCETCGKISEHHPYPKQAIEQLIKIIVKGDPEKFFEIIQRIRHSLLHGESVKNIEKQQKVNVSNMRDSLGRVVWMAILNQVKNCAKNVKDGDGFSFVQTNTYSSYSPGVAVHAVLTANRAGANPQNPKIEDFPFPPFQVSLMVREKEDSTQEHEHKPID